MNNEAIEYELDYHLDKGNAQQEDINVLYKALFGLFKSHGGVGLTIKPTGSTQVRMRLHGSWASVEGMIKDLDRLDQRMRWE